jgi:hypothetical protein
MGMVANMRDWVLRRQHDDTDPPRKTSSGLTDVDNSGLLRNFVNDKYAWAREEGRRVALAGGLLLDEGRMKTHAAFIDASIRAEWQPAFDPARHEQDRTLRDRADYLRERLFALRTEKVSCNQLRRDVVLKTPAYRRPPAKPLGLMVLAVAVSAWGFGSSLMPFFGDIPDAVLAWSVAALVGGSIGALLTWALFHD